MLLPAPQCAVRHGYDEPLKPEIRTYSLEEICAEKLRATQQTLAKLKERGWTRSRVALLGILPADTRIDWDQVASILGDKCRLRGVQITAVEDMFHERLIDEVRSTWNRTLGPFVPNSPPVDTVIAELRDRLAVLLRL